MFIWFFERRPILHLFSFKTPTSWADLSEEGDADLWLRTQSATKALEMRNGVNLHWYKIAYLV